jgi:hypothetical protein
MIIWSDKPRYSLLIMVRKIKYNLKTAQKENYIVIIYEPYFKKK